MIVEVIKEFKKHVTNHKVGDTLGVTKDLAKYLINEGLVKDVNNVLNIKKVVKPVKETPKKVSKSKPKKK